MPEITVQAHNEIQTFESHEQAIQACSFLAKLALVNPEQANAAVEANVVHNSEQDQTVHREAESTQAQRETTTTAPQPPVETTSKIQSLKPQLEVVMAAEPRASIELDTITETAPITVTSLEEIAAEQQEYIIALDKEHVIELEGPTPPQQPVEVVPSEPAPIAHREPAPVMPSVETVPSVESDDPAPGHDEIIPTTVPATEKAPKESISEPLPTPSIESIIEQSLIESTTTEQILLPEPVAYIDGLESQVITEELPVATELDIEASPEQTETIENPLETFQALIEAATPVQEVDTLPKGEQEQANPPYTVIAARLENLEEEQKTEIAPVIQHIVETVRSIQNMQNLEAQEDPAVTHAEIQQATERLVEACEELFQTLDIPYDITEVRRFVSTMLTVELSELESFSEEAFLPPDDSGTHERKHFAHLSQQLAFISDDLHQLLGMTALKSHFDLAG